MFSKTFITKHTKTAVSLLASRCSTSPVSLRGFWEEVCQRERLVEEFLSSKRSKRIAHLARALKFLKNHNVIVHASLHSPVGSSGWNVTNDFTRVCAFGETLLRNESLVRTLKIFPSADEESSTALVEQICSPSHLACMYDKLEMNALLDRKRRREVKPTAIHKQSMILALLGEMQWFTLRTKATDRTHNNALFPPSDVLILHSLCAHSVESLIVELFLHLMEDAVGAVRGSWKNFHCSLPEQFAMKPRTIARHSLSPFPLKRRLSDQLEGRLPISPLSDSKCEACFLSAVPFPKESKIALETPSPSHQRMELASVASTAVNCSHMPQERRLELLRLHVR